LSDIGLATASAGGAPRAATSTSTISQEENPTGIVDARSVRTRAYLANTSADASQDFVLTFAAGFATAAKRTGTPVAGAAGASGILGTGWRSAEHRSEGADGSEDRNDLDRWTVPPIAPTHDPKFLQDQNFAGGDTYDGGHPLKQSGLETARPR
jgi:hypothetical protein